MAQHDGRKFSTAYDHCANDGYCNREQRRHWGQWGWSDTNREVIRIPLHNETPLTSRAARKKSKPSRSRK